MATEYKVKSAVEVAPAPEMAAESAPLSAQKKNEADDIALKAKKQVDTSRTFKQPRMTQILENEDTYNFKLKPALQGRLNVPFDGVVMTGFIDTMVAELNRPPLVQFEDPNGSNLKTERKVTAAWKRDAKRMRLNMKDRALKHMAAMSGRAIAKYYAESDPKYKPCLQIVDYLDFHCEPNGGGYLDDHYFHWQENIFRSKEDLIEGARSGWYDTAQVSKLIATYASPDFKRSKDAFQNKQSRYMSLGLDMESNNYVGAQLYNLVEGDTYHKGHKYHVIWDANTGIWLRCVLLKEDFEDDRTPFISFASPQEDAFNFWNLGPADKIAPVAEAIRLNLNEILNNNRKRNWDMKAVDINMFPDLRKLDWKQDGVVHANVPLNASIQQGIYRFETPELSGAINLNAYLNNFVGEKLGISSQTQGDAKEDKVGIYRGNAIQISKRMRLISDSYEEFYEELASRYDWGLWTHVDEKEMVRLISAEGVGWEKITKTELDPEFVIIVNTSEMKRQMDSDMVRAQTEMLVSIEKDPEQMKFINKKMFVEEKFRLVEMPDDKIYKLMNTSADVTDDLISEAKKAIEIMLLGKDPGMNWGATTDFLQYISDWILDNGDDITDKQKKRIELYFDRHVPVATKNAEQDQFRQEQLLAQKRDEALLADPEAAASMSIGANAAPAPVPVDNQPVA